MKHWVVIPTVGRKSLERLVFQILQDATTSHLEINILIALNGAVNLDFLAASNVQVLTVSKFPIGVAKTMNLALQQVSEGIVWTIADDEEWCAGKFRTDLQDFSDPDAPEILSPIAFFEDELGREIRPKNRIKKDEKILDYFYGSISLGRNPNYFSLSGAVARKQTWLKVKFPEGLLSREDTLYLVEQERLGTTFGHGSKPTVKISTDLKRAVRRDSDIEEVIRWGSEHLTPKQFLGLVGCGWCKPFVASRDTKKLMAMIKALVFLHKSRFSFSVRARAVGLLIIWSIFSLLPVNQLARIRQMVRYSHKRIEA